MKSFWIVIITCSQNTKQKSTIQNKTKSWIWGYMYVSIWLVSRNEQNETKHCLWYRAAMNCSLLTWKYMRNRIRMRTTGVNTEVITSMLNSWYHLSFLEKHQYWRWEVYIIWHNILIYLARNQHTKRSAPKYLDRRNPDHV